MTELDLSLILVFSPHRVLRQESNGLPAGHQAFQKTLLC